MVVNSNQKSYNTTTNFCYMMDITAVTQMCVNQYVYHHSWWFSLTSSVSLSIITANRNGLNDDLCWSPTLTLKLSVVPTAHLTTVSLPSYTYILY